MSPRRKGNGQNGQGRGKNAIYSPKAAEAAMLPAGHSEIEMTATKKDGSQAQGTLLITEEFFDYLRESVDLDNYFEERGWTDTETPGGRFQAYSKDCGGYEAWINQRKDRRWVGNFGSNKYNCPPSWCHTDPRVLEQRIQEFMDEFVKNPDLREQTEQRGNWHKYTDQPPWLKPIPQSK